MDLISGWCRSTRRLDDVTAIVTGSNTGIGKQTAMDLYKRGAKVIMACRNLEKAQTAKKDLESSCASVPNLGNLCVEELDLSRLKSVKEFASKILATEQLNLKILINNAGVMMCPEGETEDGFETHIGTNHFGHALLTILLLPLLRASAPSRIVFVSSYLHERYDLDLEDINFKKHYDPFKAYCRSKAANVMFATVLANKLKDNNINDVTVYSLHPGVIRTEISRHFSETYLYGATWVFNNVFGLFLKSPLCGAQTTIYCAVDEACNGESGLYYSDCALKKPSKQSQREDQIEKLWQITISALGLDKNNVFCVKSSND